ncbi:MAG: hypothetical protein ACYDEN_12445 [Acidimicrobiales bacterium]
MFLTLLLFCAQVLVHLYATSMVTAAATDAADAVAQAGGAPAAVPVAQADAVASLGGWGAAHTSFDWLVVGPDVIRLRVVAESPGFLDLPGVSRVIRRTVTVRTEVFRGAP